MARKLESYYPPIQEDGLVTAKPVVITDGTAEGYTTGITNSNLNVVGTNAIGMGVGAQNQSTTGWTAFVAEANTGTDTANYCNMFINGTAFSDSNYTIQGALDGGVYTNGGNLVIGTQTASKDVVVHVGGTLAANEVIRFVGANAAIKFYDNGTATATAGAATLAKNHGKITSESLTTAAGATYTLTITDSRIAATDLVYASVAMGTATTGVPVITTVKPAAGSVAIIIQNIAAAAALNGTIVVSFSVFKTA
jgi:hypothetical protein